MVPTEQITKERLDSWKARMKESNATPVLLVGVGHDQTSGQLVICTVEDIANDYLRSLLVFALQELG